MATSRTVSLNITLLLPCRVRDLCVPERASTTAEPEQSSKGNRATATLTRPFVEARNGGPGARPCPSRWRFDYRQPVSYPPPSQMVRLSTGQGGSRGTTGHDRLRDALDRDHRSARGANVNYPNTDRDGDVADDYCGTMVSDPYRWMENADDSRLPGWIAAQNVVTNDWMSATADAQRVDLLLEWLTVFDPMGVPDEEGAVRFFNPSGRTLRRARSHHLRLPGQQDQQVPGHRTGRAADRWQALPAGRLVAELGRQAGGGGPVEDGSQKLEIRFVKASDGTMLADRLPTHPDTELSWLPGGQEVLYMRAGTDGNPTPTRHTVGSSEDTRWPSGICHPSTPSFAG